MVAPIDTQAASQLSFVGADRSQASRDAYDLDIQVDAKRGTGEMVNQLITSKSLCTPGCGNTGTNNSFCC